MKSKARKRRLRKRLLFTLIVLILFFGLAEGVLRVLDFRFEPYLNIPTWWARYEGQPIYTYDPYLFWRLRPSANDDLDPDSRHTQRVNARGFRDDDFEWKKADEEFRVITLGDSCTFGDGVANKEAYGNALEALLREAMPDRKVTVVNAGVPGYTSYQILSYLERELLSLKPDVVTAYVGFNDNVPATDSIPDSNRRPRNATLHDLYNGMRESRIVQALDYAVGSRLRRKPRQVISKDPDHRTFRVPFEEYVRNICRVKERGDAKGFTPIVMTLPHRFVDESERNPLIRQAAENCKIPLVDLWKIMKTHQNAGEELYEPDGGHPNWIGHKRIAQALAAKLVELGIVPQAPPAEPPGTYAGVETTPEPKPEDAPQ